MSNGQSEPQIVDRLKKLESLLPEIDKLPDADVREKVGELVRTVLEFHGEGLARLVEQLRQNDAGGGALVTELARDELIGSLLILHGLHPLDLQSRVREGLETVMPLLKSHGGSVNLLNVTPEGEVYLRLEGSCHGCASSRVTLESSIESAIYAAAPDVAGIHVEGLVDEPSPALSGGFVPLAQLAGTVAAGQNGST
ncbi:MAG TPA: NifU family protein [Pirellulales bacterium]|jgi:Fe-S cluster biogenesis protein NfuA|nr:NifU family protein [Pirellulales bacterium]